MAGIGFGKGISGGQSSSYSDVTGSGIPCSRRASLSSLLWVGRLQDTVFLEEVLNGEGEDLIEDWAKVCPVVAMEVGEPGYLWIEVGLGMPLEVVERPDE